MRKNPAHCSKALPPNLGTFLSCLRELIFPSCLRKVTMFSAEAPMELPIGKMFSIGKK
jgi:hypothetical protein